MSIIEHEAHEPIREEDVLGLKYFRKLWPLFERLREVGCQRDKAGNRELFMRGTKGSEPRLFGTAFALSHFNLRWRQS